TLPPTTVQIGRPDNVIPAYGVFLPLLDIFAGSTTQRAAGSITVMSSSAPLRKVPPGRLNSRAGEQDIRSTRVEKSSTPLSTRWVMHTATAVSRPIIP